MGLEAFHIAGAGELVDEISIDHGEGDGGEEDLFGEAEGILGGNVLDDLLGDVEEEHDGGDGGDNEAEAREGDFPDQGDIFSTCDIFGGDGGLGDCLGIWGRCYGGMVHREKGFLWTIDP
jgi:hypothetical protein